MGRCCQMVMGPAGTGKSTYCRVVQEWARASRRTLHVVNLDPAAEEFGYDVAFDVRDLITVADVMEELNLGANGGLVYCMEYLLDNLDWIQDELNNYDDDEYIVFDCPGQVELYSHIPIMKRVMKALQDWGFNIAGVFLLDATFMSDVSKFMAGSLLSLSAMVQLEVPHINVLSKCDLADSQEVSRFLDSDTASLLALLDASDVVSGAPDVSGIKEINITPRLKKLTEALSSVIDEYSLVGFIPLDISDEESIGLVMMHADMLVQFGENQEPREPREELEPEESV
eukprot:44509_1